MGALGELDWSLVLKVNTTQRARGFIWHGQSHIDGWDPNLNPSDTPDSRVLFPMPDSHLLAKLRSSMAYGLCMGGKIPVWSCPCLRVSIFQFLDDQ